MKNSRNTVEQESPRLPRTFVIELTRRCNNSCLYCYGWWPRPGNHKTQTGQAEMYTAEVKEVVLKLQAETPVENIAFSGGEPLLRGDLPELVAFVSGRGIDPVVITNGTLLSEERVDATLVDGGSYEITLLSHRREVHDFLAGREGAWDATVNGIANIGRAGGTFTVVFVATRLNHLDLLKTAELAIALGAEGLMYNRMNLGARNMLLADRLLPEPDMIRENLVTLELIGGKYKLPIAVTVAIEPCVVDVRKFQNIHFGWCPLGGENSYFTIDPAGNMRVCNHSPTILGNIKHDSFRRLYRTHPFLTEFREKLPEECQSCDRSWKSVCRGGCKAAAEQCYGTIKRVDPFVTLSLRQRQGQDKSGAP